MDIVNRFLRYVRIDTQSAEDAGVTPSTPGQMEFVKVLRNELEEMGLEEITLDEHGYLFATLPANTTRTVPTIGFIAHVDTSPDVTGKDVNPRIVENYNGCNITLSAEDRIILSTAEFPELLSYVGDNLIVTDGHTLLGADDKAGIAEIISAIAYLQAHPEIEHGKIRIGFNPDEEIGLGAHKFDVNLFGCDLQHKIKKPMTKKTNTTAIPVVPYKSAIPMWSTNRISSFPTTPPATMRMPYDKPTTHTPPSMPTIIPCAYLHHCDSPRKRWHSQPIW